jgi:thiamine monophosphate kinase
LAANLSDMAAMGARPRWATLSLALPAADERWLEQFAYGFLDLARSNTRPVVGDVVRIVPNHVCVVVNMMDEVVMVRGDEIIGTLPVAARGKLR